MQWSGSALLLLLATRVYGTSDKDSLIEETYKKFMLVPMLIDDPPHTQVSVHFSSWVVNPGDKIPAYAASIPPYIYYEADPKCLYTILMTDVDWPYAAAPIGREFLHACLVNTPGNNLAKSNYLTCYFPPSPPPGSGHHRIAVMVFKQSKKIDITSPCLQNLHRNNTRFSTKNFAATYGLGKAIAGNMFFVQRTVCPDDEQISLTCTS